MITESILGLLVEHGILASFLAGFVTGETVILILAFYSATGGVPLWNVLIFATIGMYLSDFIPFFIGKTGIFKKIFKGSLAKKTKKLENLFLKHTRNNLFLTILYTKFIYGASIPALIYLGHKKTKISRFSLFNLYVELIFVPLVVAIGWLAGKGFTIAKIVFQNIRIAIFLLFVLIVILVYIRRWIDKKLIEKQKQ